jgi:hypothetical protein
MNLKFTPHKKEKEMSTEERNTPTTERAAAITVIREWLDDMDQEQTWRASQPSWRRQEQLTVAEVLASLERLLEEIEIDEEEMPPLRHEDCVEGSFVDAEKLAGLVAQLRSVVGDPTRPF